MVVAKTIEHILQPEIMQRIGEKCYALQVEQRENNSDVLFYQQRLAEIKRGIKNTMHAIESGVRTKSLPQRLAELEEEQEQVEAELAIAKASDFVITAEQIEFLLWQFASPLDGESWDDYKRRIIKCFVHRVFLFDDKLLIHYNMSRDGNTREKSVVEAFSEAQAISGQGFDQRSSGSTISIAGRTPNDEIIILPYGVWLALDLTVQV